MDQIFLVSRQFLSDEDGVTAIEYALIAALIAVVIIATVFLVGQQVNAFFLRVKNCIQTPATCGT